MISNASQSPTLADQQPDQSHSDEERTAARHLERRLRESYEELWQSAVDPQEALTDVDGARWNLVGDVAGGCLPGGFFNEPQLREIRNQCRLLAMSNEYAINGHENRVSYIIGAGHSYRAAPKKGRAASPELAGAVQAGLDEFIRLNHWHRRQQEIVRRRDRDGEAFLRFFVDADGATRIRFVEPGQITTPAGSEADPTLALGIQTSADDVETVLAYWVDGRPIDASQIQHRKANVDCNVRRGLPLFYPVRKNLRRADKLLRNMSAVAAIQSAIALIRKHRGGTKTGVQQFVAGQADLSLQPVGGKTMNFKRYEPGTILDAHGGLEYDFPAAGLDAGNFVTVLQAELRAIASRLVMPEFMLTSDASNANYASTMVAEGPAMKMFARLQAEQIESDLEVMWRVVANLVDAGRLPPAALEAIEIQVSPPSLTVRDQLQEAQTFRIEHDSGILSPQTWSQKRGLDYDQEQMNLAAHAKKQNLASGAV